MKKLIACLMVLCMAFAAFACSKPADVSAAPVKEDNAAIAQEAVAVSAASTPTPEKENAFDYSKVKIGTISYGSNQSGVLLLSGVKAACDEVGAEMLAGYHNFDVNTEMELFQNYMTIGVDGICASLANDNSSLQAARNAAAQGIIISTINSAVEVDVSVCGYYSNPYELGTKCAEMAAEKVNTECGGNAVIGILGVSTASVQSIGRIAGFTETMQKLCTGKVEVVATQYPKGIDESIQVASDMLLAFPQINILFGATESHVCGNTQAIKNAGLQGKAWSVGVDLTDQICKMLIDDANVLIGTVGQDMFQMGYNSAKELLAVIGGEEPDPALVGKLTGTPVIPIKSGDKAAIDQYLEMIEGQYNDKIL